jgi:hypothetical protein
VNEAPCVHFARECQQFDTHCASLKARSWQAAQAEGWLADDNGAAAGMGLLTKLSAAISCRSTAFLPVLLLILGLVAGFAAEIMFTVYIDGSGGARRCRSVVLLSLVALCVVALVVLRLSRLGVHIFLGATHSSQGREQLVAMGLVVFFFGFAWLLGLGDEVQLREDLAGNPFKMMTSRCQSAHAWHEEILGER